jgi:glycosyltransferase involved in cell wall biosynthesis
VSKVSIVVPCYNSGHFLPETVASALAQTYADLDVIIVDDGSTDPATVALLDNASWPRTRIIRQANGGPSAARNTAVAASDAEFILPLDADDTIHPSYVEKAVAAIQSRPEVGIVYCKAQRFGAESGPWNLPPYTLREMVIDNVIFVSSLYRKADWATVGGYSEGLRHGVEDYDFWVKLLALGRDVIQLDEVLFNYRIQETSRTTTFSQDRSVIAHTYAEIFRGNIDFYARNAEMLFEHRFGLYDELTNYRRRYGALDRFVERKPWLKSMARFAVKVLNRLG